LVSFVTSQGYDPLKLITLVSLRALASPMKSSTIFAVSALWRPRSSEMAIKSTDIGLLPDGPPGPRRFKIKAAETHGLRGMVDHLLKSRYGWRGYRQVSLPTDQSVHRFTLAAIEHESTIGTITVGFDGPFGLGAEDTFAEDVAALRNEGRKLCEFTKLAIDPTVGSKRVLAALFHVAYIVAHRIRRYDTLLIEVNPRHAGYYQRMLGMRVRSSGRINASVNAPSVLLMADFSHIMAQIGEYGGQPDRGDARSLFPFAFTLTEEAGIIDRLNRRQAFADQRRDAMQGPPSVPPSEFSSTDIA
jgi:hypothetical protein